MNCYVVEKELINLRTGDTNWVKYDNPPANTCPSCCDPANKLLSRKAIRMPNCSEPFLGADNKTYQQRTTLVYADGDCSTRTEYTYQMPCASVNQPVKLLAVGATGACRLKVEFTGNETTIIEVSTTVFSINLPLGQYTIRALQEGCTGTVKARAMTEANGPGAVLWTQGEAPKLVQITNATIGFYIEIV